MQQFSALPPRRLVQYRRDAIVIFGVIMLLSRGEAPDEYNMRVARRHTEPPRRYYIAW